MGSERNLHKQGNAAQDNSQRNIKVPADAIPQAAAGLPAAGIDGRKQLVLFHYIEPGNSAQRIGTQQENAIKNGYRQDCPKKVISAGQNRSLFVFAANLRFLGLPEN